MKETMASVSASTTEIQEIHNQIIRAVGGKRIKRLIMHCNDNNNFANPSNDYCTTDNDVIILKNSRVLSFYTYKLQDRSNLFTFSITEIHSLAFSECGNHEYVITLYDGILYWMANIKIGR